jgi:hypothetical protein
MSVLVRLVGTAVSVSLLFATPARAAFGEGDITPESANTARFGVEQRGKQLIDSGAFAQAADLYWREGVQLKDPVLIIESAEALRDQAAAERSIDAAKSAIERLTPALEMLYYLRDSSTSAAWQPVAPEHLDTVISRAKALVTDAQSLIAAIEEEQRKVAEASAETADTEKPKRGPSKPGTVLIAAGGASLAIGLGAVGLGAAGLVLGAKAQGDVEDPLVYEPEHGAAEQRGQTANVLAGVGFALAGVGVGVGVALIMLGIKKRKQAGSAELALVPVWFGQGLGQDQGAGIGVVGRF